MTKGGDHIESDFYAFWKKSTLSSFIKGQLYRDGVRPKNAQTEDAVISFKTGLEGQFQNGELVINVYVPDINEGNTYKKDISRCREIGNLIIEDVKSFTNTEYLISLISIPKSYEAEEINQHFVNARIEFKRKSI